MDPFFSKAVNLLCEKQVIALPTDTVYGLAARADSVDAIQKLQALKKRPENKAFLILYGSLEEAQRDAFFPEMAWTIAQRYWPGPLTMVLPLKAEHRLVLGCYDLENQTVAIRIPGPSVVSSLLKEVSFPLAVPSANRAGEKTPTCFEEVCRHFDQEDLWVMPGEIAKEAQPSTLISITNNNQIVVLRQGPVDPFLI